MNAPWVSRRAYLDMKERALQMKWVAWNVLIALGFWDLPEGWYYSDGHFKWPWQRMRLGRPGPRQPRRIRFPWWAWRLPFSDDP